MALPSHASSGKTGQLSTHFRAREIACPHCHACVVSPKLIQLLESARRIAGAPVKVVSGYRCPTHNAAVAGAADSQHMYGRAADIPGGLLRPAAAVKAGAIGIGVRDGWVVHLDVREGRPAQWRY